MATSVWDTAAATAATLAELDQLNILAHRIFAELSKRAETWSEDVRSLQSLWEIVSRPLFSPTGSSPAECQQETASLLEALGGEAMTIVLRVMNKDDSLLYDEILWGRVISFLEQKGFFSIVAAAGVTASVLGSVRTTIRDVCGKWTEAQRQQVWTLLQGYALQKIGRIVTGVLQQQGGHTCSLDWSLLCQLLARLIETRNPPATTSSTQKQQQQTKKRNDRSRQ